jgi:plasmid maintenance system antidote protein VapI
MRRDWQLRKRGETTMAKMDKISQNSIEKLEGITGRKLTLGLFLLTIRECEEKSQKEFAEKLGITRQYLCDLEHDRRSVSLEKAAIFAKKTGYSESQMIRLALQDFVNKAGLSYDVDIQKTA